MTPETLEVLRSLGIATPLVVVLLWLLRDTQVDRREAQRERQEITERFLQTMETTVVEGTKAQTLAATSLQDLASSMRESSARSTDEHARMIDALGKFGRRE